MTALSLYVPLDACDEALEWISSYSDPHKAIDECPQIQWLGFVIFAHDDLQAKYERMRAPARAEYERMRAPAWAEYKRVRDAAWAEYERVRDAAWVEGERARDAARAECTRVRNAARAEYERVRAPAWAEYERARYVAARRVLHEWIENGAER